MKPLQNVLASVTFASLLAFGTQARADHVADATDGTDPERTLASSNDDVLRFVAAIDRAIEQACAGAAAHLQAQEQVSFDHRACRKQFCALRAHAVAGEVYVTSYVRRYLQNLVDVASFWRENGISGENAALQACVDGLQSAAYRGQSSFWHRWFGFGGDGTDEPSCQLSFLFPHAGAMYDDWARSARASKRREDDARASARYYAIRAAGR